MSNARFGLRTRTGEASDILQSLSASDEDALAFINAAGITNLTQQQAIIDLVIDLKGFGLWTKMKAIYPFVGGTATTHKYNLKDPRDLNAAFRLVFSGGWTHSSTGALPNGTNAYAETYLTPSTSLSQNSSHLSYYSRTNASTNSSEIGSIANDATRGIYLLYSYSGSAFKSFNSAQSQRGSVFTPTTSLLIGSRINATNEKYYHAGALIDNLSVNSSSLITSSIWIGNANSVANWSSKECAFASIGDGLTDQEAADLYTAVQAYQTTLSRNV